MLGLTRRVVLTTAVMWLAACPGDPTEASTLSADGSGETSATLDDGPTTLTADDDGSVTVSDTSADGSDTDPSDTMPDAECGNGVVEPPEECDIGPDNTMGATCTFDCTTNECGDGYVGYMESCDPPGDGCAGNCIVSTCGDGVLDEGEDCDWVMTPPPACPMNCMLGCGDGRIDPGEECEGDNLNGNDCTTVGFFGGVLQCDQKCQFVETGCTNCGDGTTQAGEECDMSVGAYDCVAAGFLDGVVTCTAGCLYDTSQCVNYLCGNNMIELPEPCDGTALGGHTCASEGFAPTGGIACTNCELDTSACLLCGNGEVDDDAEECDLDDLPITMCSALGGAMWDDGELTCSSSCEYNDSDCCSDDVFDPCEDESDCCGTLECDNQDDECCLPADAPCGGNDSACCSNDCHNGNNTCVGGDAP